MKSNLAKLLYLSMNRINLMDHILLRKPFRTSMILNFLMCRVLMLSDFGIYPPRVFRNQNINSLIFRGGEGGRKTRSADIFAQDSSRGPKTAHFNNLLVGSKEIPPGRCRQRNAVWIF